VAHSVPFVLRQGFYNSTELLPANRTPLSMIFCRIILARVLLRTPCARSRLRFDSRFLYRINGIEWCLITDRDYQMDHPANRMFHILAMPA